MNGHRRRDKYSVSIDEFRAYFHSVNNPTNVDFFQTRAEIAAFLSAMDESGADEPHTELDHPFTDKELSDGVKGLKNNKSAGEDGLIYELYKYVPQLKPLLLKLFNRILNTGEFPLGWTEGIIIPLHKKGSKNVASNYRGITILPTLSKLFTKLVNTRLSGWAERRKVFVECQAGFRAKHSTVDNVFAIE